MTQQLDPAPDLAVRARIGDVAALPSFDQAAKAVLSYLQSTYAMGLWMVTRTAGDDWIVLASAGQTYPVSDGDVFRWSDSFCSRMVEGQGPRTAPRAQDVPAYADAPIGSVVPIGSYVGIPLTGPDGDLFGTLCAIDPNPSGEELTSSQPLFELQAQLLSSLLAVELAAARHAREAESAQQLACTDVLTGLLNRAGWDAALKAEEARSRRHASPAAVVVVDLDGLKECNDEAGHAAGDDLLRSAARALAGGCRPYDVLSRTGGDEFAVLCPETAEDGGRLVATRLQTRLQRAGIRASVGVGGIDPRDADLVAAWRRADQAMYADKSARRGLPAPRQASSA